MDIKQLINQTKQKRTLSGQTYNKSYYENNFKVLLDIGQYYEKMATDRIIKHYEFKEPNIVQCHDKRCDMIINEIKYEVKTDIKAMETSNIYIEFISVNKPSGITTTQAHFYIIVIPHDIPIFIMISVETLKQMILNNKYFKIFQPNKYNNFSGGYIFKMDTLLSNALLI